MNKLAVSIVMIFAVLLTNTVVFADSGAQGPEEASSEISRQEPGILQLEPSKEYTVEELQEIAARNSRQAFADDVDIKRKELAVRTVRSDINAMSDSILSVTKPMNVKLELEVAKRTKQDHLNQLKVDVYKTCMDILLCGRKIQMLEKKLSLAEKRLEMAKARLNAAMVIRDEVDSAQYAVDSSRADLESARDELDALYLELKRLLNLPLDTVPVKVAEELKQDDVVDVDTDLILEGLYETETSVFMAAGKLEIARAAMEIAAKLYRKGDLYYDSAVLDMEEAELDLAAAKTALEVKVKNAYNDMANRADSLDLVKKYAELTAKKLGSIKTKYEKGAVSMEDCIKAEEALLDAEFAELSAIVEYNAARAVFINITGLDRPVKLSGME
ncbi:MAG: TolC family protein [Bacillota bacterium]